MHHCGVPFIALRSKFWLERIRWTKVYMNEIRCMWLCCQLPLLVFSIYKLYNDIALHYNKWSWLMKVKNHCKQKLILLSLFWTYMCSIRIDIYWSWWAKKTKFIFYFAYMHAMNIWTGWLQSVCQIMSSNSFSHCFIKLTSHVDGVWWCVRL